MSFWKILHVDAAKSLLDLSVNNPLDRPRGLGILEGRRHCYVVDLRSVKANKKTTKSSQEIEPLCCSDRNYHLQDPWKDKAHK